MEDSFLFLKKNRSEIWMIQLWILEKENLPWGDFIIESIIHISVIFSHKIGIIAYICILSKSMLEYNY